MKLHQLLTHLIEVLYTATMVVLLMAVTEQAPPHYPVTAAMFRDIL